MAIEIEYPDITAQSLNGKVNQIHSYLFQMAEQLKWAFGMLEDLEAEDRKNISEGIAGLGQQINEAVAPLKDSADYVVEKGSEGMWSWKKWESGHIDLWGNKSESIDCAKAYGNLFYSSLKEFILPNGLVNSIDAIHIDVLGSGSMFATPYDASKESVKVYFYSGKSETKTETVYFTINAKWK